MPHVVGGALLNFRQNVTKIVESPLSVLRSCGSSIQIYEDNVNAADEIRQRIGQTGWSRWCAIKSWLYFYRFEPSSTSMLFLDMDQRCTAIVSVPDKR